MTGAEHSRDVLPVCAAQMARLEVLQTTMAGDLKEIKGDVKELYKLQTRPPGAPKSGGSLFGFVKSDLFKTLVMILAALFAAIASISSCAGR